MASEHQQSGWPERRWEVPPESGVGPPDDREPIVEDSAPNRLYLRTARQPTLLWYRALHSGAVARTVRKGMSG